MFGVRFRSVSVREGVYEVLARLVEERGDSISCIITELINNAVDLNKHLGEVKELFRQRLDKLNRQQTTTQFGPQLINIHETTINLRRETIKPQLVSFEDNPWVHIIRAKVTSDEGGERR